MELNTLKLFKYFNQEYASTFSLDDVDNLGQVPCVTGILKQDAFLVHVRNHYGVALIRNEPDPDVFSKWEITVIDSKKFSWLMLKI